MNDSAASAEAARAAEAQQQADAAAAAERAAISARLALDVSSFTPAAAPNGMPSLTAPQFTNAMLDPTPVANNATLTAPNFSANMLQSTPMGQLASFERPVPIPQPRPAHLTQAAATANLTQAAATANLTYGANANAAAVSAHSQAVLADIMATAGVTSATVTSTARTPADQARAMYDNLQTQGVARQRELYGRFGDQVIDAYEEAVGAGLSRPEVEQAMVDRINELGPSNVSRHLANPDQLNVVDISPRSIPEGQRDAFIAAIRAHPSVSNFLGPADGDPAFHIEITQPQPE